MDVGRLSVGVTEFVVMRVWFTIKQGASSTVICKENEGRSRNKEGGRGGCLPCYNLNITNEIIDEY
jgi:hypothetical protein